MGVASIFDTRKQMTFYGVYHNNPTNIFIHLFGVPLLLWSGEVMAAATLRPDFLPAYHYKINNFLEFDFNLPFIWTILCVLYYFVLEPVAALLYVPQLTLSFLSATAFAHRVDAFILGTGLHIFAWIAQFLGHAFAEKRAPALLDNVLGAVVLAPFFVHLEVLFGLGYNRNLAREIQNSTGVEIARLKKAEGDKKRAEAARSQ